MEVLMSIIRDKTKSREDNLGLHGLKTWIFLVIIITAFVK